MFVSEDNEMHDSNLSQEIEHRGELQQYDRAAVS